MIAIEIACIAIVAAYLAFRLRAAPEPMAVVRRLALLACAGWIGEDTMIRAYGFYAYSPAWGAFVDRAPALIAIIWPIVIDSAAELARSLVRPTRVPLAAGLIVLADASLIEPIAVRAGLWSWTEPGMFDVPLIGILGWAVFATIAIAHLERSKGMWQYAVLAVAPAGAHAALVALWWSAFRWWQGPLSSALAAVIAWGLLVPAAALAWRWARPRVDARALLLRAPGALFFFVLLALHRDDVCLVAYALAFAAPYVAVLRLPRGARAAVA